MIYDIEQDHWRKRDFTDSVAFCLLLACGAMAGLHALLGWVGA